MIYPSNFESKLGFDSVRSRIAELCESNLGRQRAASFTFSSNLHYLDQELGQTDEMKSLLDRALERPDVPFYNLEGWLMQLSVEGSHTSASNFLNLKKTLESFKAVRDFYCRFKEPESRIYFYPYLSNVFKNLQDFPFLISEIDLKIDKKGGVRDNASSDLYEIRKQLSSIQGQISRTMARVMAAAQKEGLVEKDTSPAMRDGRMVLPVAAAKKRLVSGIIHDESASGKTVFIEPAEVVEVSNRLRELQLSEQREIIRILTELADVTRPHIEDILRCNEILGVLDFITAKARYALTVGGHRPVLEKRPEIDWYGAVHPVLFESLASQNRKVVPLNLRLDRKNRFLIISGPNAGGKSVTLKTVGIVQYMMQCGVLPTLHDNSHMGIFRNIFIDIGDEQSIENDLSTYSSHLLNMKFFLSHANRDTLVLADEMGSGTEPQIGGALAESILKELSRERCFGIVTTHYFNLKNFAETEEGFVNGSMLYDRQQFKPTFQLEIGSPGSSYAIEIAQKIGLPKGVIDNAKEIAGSEYIDTERYLAEINRDKKYWKSKRQNIKLKESKLESIVEEYEKAAEELKAQRKKILQLAREEANEILSSANARIENTISEIKAASAEREKTKEIRKELQDFRAKLSEEQDDAPLTQIKTPRLKKPRRKPAVQAEENVPVLKRNLEVGDYVKMAGANTVGRIMSISGKDAEVAFGNLRTMTKLNKLVAAAKPAEKLQSGYELLSPKTSEESRKRQLDFNGELDVRGMRGEEALDMVTHFIDDAVQFYAGRVRILHGTGHGILRQLIRESLSRNPHVVDFKDEDVRFGGAGITIVNLR